MEDVIIIGCGVVGAACAYALSRYELNVTVLEAGSDIAAGTTKANSAIIHAGYDPMPGTDMAKMNLEGSAMAEGICRRLDVPYERVGSLVLAFDDTDLRCLQTLLERGQINGVEGLKLLSGEEARAMEPNVSEQVRGALWAPTAAIINPWEYCLAMAETAVKNNVRLHRNCRVTGIRREQDGFLLTTTGGEFTAKYLINAAGVYADTVHELIGEKEFTIRPSRGEYYLLDKCEGQRVRHVIFQCPGKEGKGILVAPTVHGNLIVGPTACSCAPEDVSNTSDGLYQVRERALKSVPTIAFRENIRNFAGVRAASDVPDFIVRESRSVPGFFQAAGICSPGLSAAPAIAKRLTELLARSGLELREKTEYDDSRRRLRFTRLTDGEKNELIAKDPRFGRVICRCETVTEGEIVACLHTPIPPRSVNGVKRRVGAGMGRCQGGFCGPRVQEIIARELHMDPMDVMLEEEGSYILTGETKGGEARGL